MSGRRRASSDGRPTGTRGGTGGTGFGSISSACNAFGGWPSSRLMALMHLRFLLLEPRDLGGRGAQLRRGVRHVEIGGHAAGRALLRELAGSAAPS